MSDDPNQPSQHGEGNHLQDQLQRLMVWYERFNKLLHSYSA